MIEGEVLHVKFNCLSEYSLRDPEVVRKLILMAVFVANLLFCCQQELEKNGVSYQEAAIGLQ